MMMAKIVQRSELYLSGYENMITKDSCEYDGDYNGDDQSSGSHDYEDFAKVQDGARRAASWGSDQLCVRARQKCKHQVHGEITFQIFILFLLHAMCILETSDFELHMTQLLLLGKFEYTGGPIFKVVLEC